MKIELTSLPLCAQWHRDQTKLYKRLARDARTEGNVKYCTDRAYLHERWASAIEEAHSIIATMKGKTK